MVSIETSKSPALTLALLATRSILYALSVGSFFPVENSSLSGVDIHGRRWPPQLDWNGYGAATSYLGMQATAFCKKLDVCCKPSHALSCQHRPVDVFCCSSRNHVRQFELVVSMSASKTMSILIDWKYRLDWHSIHFGFPGQALFFTSGVNNRYLRVFRSNPPIRTDTKTAQSAFEAVDVCFGVSSHLQSQVMDTLVSELGTAEFPDNIDMTERN